MAKIKIKITKDHLKLIKQFKVETINDYKTGFDTINPYGGMYLMEDLAMILGYWDKAVEGTERDYDGRKFGIDNEIKMLEIHTYVIDNINFILSILIQFSDKGIKPGVYTSLDYDLNWEYSKI